MNNKFFNIRRMLAVGVVLGICAMSSAAQANTWTVTSLADDGTAGTLRSAIGSSASGDAILFAPGLTGTIALNHTLGVLSINHDLTISGPGPASLAVSGADGSGSKVGVFAICPGGCTAAPNVTVSGLTIENGTGLNGRGGGIFNNGGNLTVSNCTVSGNYADAGGGGIYNTAGTLTVANSTVSGNVGNGGGIANYYGGTVTVTNSTLANNVGGQGGGIWNISNSNMTVINSTLAGNHAGSYGGGIWIYQPNGRGVVALVNDTLWDNSAGSSTDGGGVYALYGVVTVKGTIIGHDSSTTGNNCSIQDGVRTSAGYNLSSDVTCGFFTQVGDMRSTDPQLDPNGLQNNGGATQTIALASGSPAIDAITPDACTDLAGNPVATDQRGVPRPQGEGCDIGAFEVLPTATVQPPISPDGYSVFNANKGVVPVKFTLEQNGVSTCSLPPATLSVTRLSGANAGSVDESDYELAADSGSSFRIDSSACQYVYNLAASDLGAGSYRVDINISGIAVGSATFSLQ
jgi:hypothetical protein